MRKILRIGQVVASYGKTRSPIYDDIQRGTFVKPVKIGPRAAGWPEDEVGQIIDARIAGADDAAIKRLVEKLHVARAVALA